MPRPTLAVFDLDGTILDTLADLAASTNFALAANGLSPRTVGEVRLFVGNGIRNLIVRSVCAASGIPVIEGASCAPGFESGAGEAEKQALLSLIDRVHASFTSHYKIHCADSTRPYDGIPGLLRNIRDRGIKTAVVSNKADYGVQKLCERYFPGLFDYAAGEREGIRRKPAPDGVLAVMKRLGAGRNGTVYIGDSDVDIETARNAGIPCISVGWGFRDEDFLRAHGAGVIARSPGEILGILG